MLIILFFSKVGFKLMSVVFSVFNIDNSPLLDAFAFLVYVNEIINVPLLITAMIYYINSTYAAAALKWLLGFIKN